ncbi:MAG TPA: transcriptional repressor [Pyrinomonadaceae bacterium]|jgi:Fe2+ or Zn2+ uptake regulation protein
MNSSKPDRRGQGGRAGGGDGLTRQRRAVLQVVRDSNGHLTAAEIYAAAQKLLPSISYATVYNSLRYLKAAGLLGEITFGNAASRYDRETRRHDHAVCTACGKLLDFDLAETESLLKLAARRSRFKPASIHLTLVGLCPDCTDEGAATTRGKRRRKS